MIKTKSATNFQKMKESGLAERTIHLTIKKALEGKIKVNDLYDDNNFENFWYSMDVFFENNPDLIFENDESIVWEMFLNAKHIKRQR